MTWGSLEHYTRAGDVAVVAICLVVVILLQTSYVSHTRSLRIYMNILVSLVAAALVNILYHSLQQAGNPDGDTLIRALGILYQALLFDVFFLFTLYTTQVSGMNHREARAAAIISSLLFVGILVADIVRTVLGVGFQSAGDGTVVHRTDLFVIGYLLYVLLLLVLIKLYPIKWTLPFPRFPDFGHHI